ncbi:MAG: SlyX protein [Halieaceae bacterium]
MSVNKSVEELVEQVLELQTQMSFQEDVIVTLNDQVTQLQKDVEALNLRWSQTRDQIRELSETDESAGGESPPPHY